MDERIDGWINGWMDGWMEVLRKGAPSQQEELSTMSGER